MTSDPSPPRDCVLALKTSCPQKPLSLKHTGMGWVLLVVWHMEGSQHAGHALIPLVQMRRVIWGAESLSRTARQQDLILIYLSKVPFHPIGLALKMGNDLGIVPKVRTTT